MPFQTGISFENFKSFKDRVHFDFASFTILTGGNSSGKTSVHQALSFYNTFIEETIKKDFNRFDKSEKDKLLTSLFTPIDSSKFVTQNKIFSNILNRDSNSDNLFFEIPLVLDSYSNKVTAKLDFKLNRKVNSECSLVNFVVYDNHLNEPLIEYSVEYSDHCRELIMKTNFNLFYKDISTRIQKFNTLKNCIIEIVEKFGIDNISDNSDDVLKVINNNIQFKNLSENIFGEVVGLIKMSKYNQVLNFNDYPGRFNDDSDFFIKFNDSNIYLFTFKSKFDFINYYFEKHRNFILNGNKTLDSYITSGAFEILQESYYENKSKNILDQEILNKISNYSFSYELNDSIYHINYLSNRINNIIFSDILEPNSKDEIYYKECCLTNIFIDFVNDFIFYQISKSLLSFNLNVIDNSKNIPIERYFDLRDSKYDFIGDYFNYKHYSNIESWLKEFNIGNKLTSKIIDNNFLSVLIDDDRNIADEGQGVKNLVYIMLKLNALIKRKGLFYRPNFVYLEEPESGLHPAFQSILAKLLFSICKNYNLQFVIETHSEYFIRQLQVLVATNEANPSDIMIYYFNSNANQAPFEKCYEITIDEYGTLSRNFGSGFFDESSNLNVLLYTINRDNYN